MPELAEVETVKRYLEKHITNYMITSYEQFQNKLRYQLDEPSTVSSNIVNSKITSIRRRAKYLLIDLSNSQTIVFVMIHQNFFITYM